LPEQYTTLLEAPIREVAFTVTLSSSPVGANQTPPATSVLAAVPVVGATISHDKPKKFTNRACDGKHPNQFLLFPGRTPLYLTAFWTDQHSHQPSKLVAALEAIASFLSPLSVLFPTGIGNLLKEDTSIAQSMSDPYSKFLSTLDTSYTETETSSGLRQGYYLVKTPGGFVEISVDRIPSLRSKFNIPQIRNAFDSSLEDLGEQVRKDPKSCIAIGRKLELYKNLSHADAVYALARSVVASAIPAPDVVTCLGTVYGPEVVKESYWKEKSGIILSADTWRDTQNPEKFLKNRFNEIAVAMNDYAAGIGDKAVLSEYFQPEIKVKDLTNTTTPLKSVQSLAVDQLLDKLKGSPKQYIYFGCHEPDASEDDDNRPAVGFLLAIAKSLKKSESLVLRTWWKLDRPNNTRPRIYQMFISVEPDVVAKVLSDYKDQCGQSILLTG
jgi:hypothetical protein